MRNKKFLVLTLLFLIVSAAVIAGSINSGCNDGWIIYEFYDDCTGEYRGYSYSRC